MAVNETVGINLVADTKSFRAQFKEASQDLQRIQATFGEYSKEALEAAKNVASLKDRIQEARETVDLFDPGKRLQAVTGVVNSVAGAYAGLQGALALVGVESEDVQKQLLKVQGALALSQGISTVLDSAKDFQRLGAIIKTQVVTAFSTLRGAILATGVGALAIGLGLLIANFDKVSAAVLRAIPGLRTFANFIGNITQKVTDFIGITSQSDRALELYAKNSANRKATYERELKVLEAQGGQEKKISELRKKIVQEDINVLEARKRNGKQLSDDENKNLKDAYNQKVVIAESYNAKIKTVEEKQKSQAQIDQEESIKLFEEEQHRKYEAYEANEKKIYEDRTKEAKNATSILDKIEAQGEKNQMLRMARIDKAIKGFNASELQVTQLTQDAKLSIIGNAVGAAANLIGRNTLAGKALAIAQATLDTYAGANKALAAYPPPFGAIAAGTVIAGGLANVSAIVNTQIPQFEGFSGGGSNFASSASAPIAPQFTPPAPTALDSASLNTISNVVARAYVVESDISGSQKRIKRIENAARI
jgi:hypothetical protein